MQLLYRQPHGYHEDDRAQDGHSRAAFAGDSRAQGARNRRSALHQLPACNRRRPRSDAHRRRRQHVHRLHRRRRLPERRPLEPSSRPGGAGAARALQPHRLHDRPVRGLRHARRAAARAGAVPGPRRRRSSTPAPRRSRTRSSSRAPTRSDLRSSASRAPFTDARCSRCR